LRWIVAAAVVVAGAVGATAFLLLRTSAPIHFPDAIDGVPKQTSALAQGLIQGMDRQATVAGHQPESAIYGNEAAPSYLILVYDFPIPGQVDSFFTGGATGFARSSGGSVDLASKQIQTRESTQYECAPFVVSTRRGELCVWLDASTSAVVIELTEPAVAIDTAARIHDLVVS
jgi:hypothetical protein